MVKHYSSLVTRDHAVSWMDIRSKYSIQANTLVAGKFEKSWIAISKLWYWGYSISPTIWEVIDARDIIHVHVIVSHARVVYKNDIKRITVIIVIIKSIAFQYNRIVKNWRHMNWRLLIRIGVASCVTFAMQLYTCKSGLPSSTQATNGSGSSVIVLLPVLLQLGDNNEEELIIGIIWLYLLLLNLEASWRWWVCWLPLQVTHKHITNLLLCIHGRSNKHSKFALIMNLIWLQHVNTHQFSLPCNNSMRRTSIYMEFYYKNHGYRAMTS